jgi:hypothetical protein
MRHVTVLLRADSGLLTQSGHHKNDVNLQRWGVVLNQMSVWDEILSRGC